MNVTIEQIYTNCLAEAAYYIECNGEAVVIDPMREPEPYMERAKKSGAKIKFVFETHFHADFISGHLDLSRLTGAPVVFGPLAEPEFESHIATDGEEFKVGDATIIAMHTPGHTPESTTYLLKDENGKNCAIFTGDTLFIGDVGRPDLAIKSDLSKEDLAGMLYDSLYHKILPLQDEVVVYPAHGAGSACGKNLSSETFDTLGNQKKHNYALNCSSKEAFIKQVTEGILPPPQYFPKNAEINKSGYDPHHEIMGSGMNALDVDEFKSLMGSGSLLIDTRNRTLFVHSHIPGALFFGLDGMFASWVGTLITDLSTPIILVTESEKEEESVSRLARVGYTNVKGFLKGGISSWEKSGEKLVAMKQVDADELETLMNEETPVIADVRKPGEFKASHVENAISYPLDFLNENESSLPKEEAVYVHCKSGYRSVIAISILEKAGYTNLVDVAGGFQEMEKTAIPTVENSCEAV